MKRERRKSETLRKAGQLAEPLSSRDSRSRRSTTTREAGEAVELDADESLREKDEREVVISTVSEK